MLEFIFFVLVFVGKDLKVTSEDIFCFDILIVAVLSSRDVLLNNHYVWAGYFNLFHREKKWICKCYNIIYIRFELNIEY